MEVAERSETSWGPCEEMELIEPDEVKTFELSNIREGGTWLTNQSWELRYERHPYRVSVLRRVAANYWKDTTSVRFEE